jgi:hypothetical protein
MKLKSFWVIPLIMLIGASCTKIETGKKNPGIGTFEVCIDYGCATPKKTVKCEDVGAFIQSDPTTGTILNIQGVFPDNTAVQLILSWDGNMANNTFNLAESNVNNSNWGIGTFYPVFGQPKVYNTAYEGSTGTVSITSLDRDNNRISGSYHFKGKYFNGSDYEEDYKDVVGTFTNIPIYDPSTGAGPCSGSGAGTGTGTGTGTAKVTYHNTTFTDVAVNFNGQQTIITPGMSATFSGTAKTTFSASASTSGKNSSGGQVGLLMQWDLNGTFPASGTQTIDLNVSGSYFFVKLVNNSGKIISKFYSNYGLQAQTTENLNIPADGLTYSLGYYQAFSNSNIRAESGATYWQWTAFGFAGTVNQVVTLTANP